MSTVAEVIKRLQGYDPNSHVAVAIWRPEDVIDRGEDLGANISQEEAEEIIDKIGHKQDADIGINWNVIDCYVQDFLYSGYLK